MLLRLFAAWRSKRHVFPSAVINGSLLMQQINLKFNYRIIQSDTRRNAVVFFTCHNRVCIIFLDIIVHDFLRKCGKIFAEGFDVFMAGLVSRFEFVLHSIHDVGEIFVDVFRCVGWRNTATKPKNQAF